MKNNISAESQSWPWKYKSPSPSHLHAPESYRNLDEGNGLLQGHVYLLKLISFPSQRTEFLSWPLHDHSTSWSIATCVHLWKDRVTSFNQKLHIQSSQNFSMIMPIDEIYYFNNWSMISNYNKGIMLLRYKLLKAPILSLQNIYSHFQIQKGDAPWAEPSMTNSVPSLMTVAVWERQMNWSFHTLRFFPLAIYREIF